MSKRRIKKPPPPPEAEPEPADTSEGSDESSGFSGSGRSIPQSLEEEDLQSRRDKEREEAQKRELLAEITYIFEEHAKLCSDIESSLKNIDSIIRRMSALRQRMSESPVSSLNLARRLNFESLYNDMRVASQRVGRVRRLSLFMNLARRDSTIQDTRDDKVSFE